MNDQRISDDWFLFIPTGITDWLTRNFCQIKIQTKRL